MKHVQIFMVTGNVLAEDVEESFISGANRVLIKPLKAADFQTIIGGNYS